MDSKVRITERLEIGLKKRFLIDQLSTDNEFKKGYVLVQIPQRKVETTFDPSKVILAKLVNTALLTFQEVDESKNSAEGAYLPADVIKAYEKKRILSRGTMMW